MHMQRLAGFSTGRAAPAFIHPCRRSCHLPAARRSTSTWRMARRAPTCPALAQATPSAPPACSTTCASPRWGGGWAEWSCSASVPRCDRWLGVLPASHSVLPPPARSAAHLPACLPGLPARLPLQIFGALTKSANTDIHEVIGEDATTNNMHHNAEQFDRKTEMSFKYLQVGAAVPVCGAGAVVWRMLRAPFRASTPSGAAPALPPRPMYPSGSWSLAASASCWVSSAQLAALQPPLACPPLLLCVSAAALLSLTHAPVSLPSPPRQAWPPTAPRSCVCWA